MALITINAISFAKVFIRENIFISFWKYFIYPIQAAIFIPRMIKSM